MGKVPTTAALPSMPAASGVPRLPTLLSDVVINLGVPMTPVSLPQLKLH